MALSCLADGFLLPRRSLCRADAHRACNAGRRPGLGRYIYNRLFSLHGIIMVWFFLVPSIPATLGNFLLPLMIGARDLAFPRLNLASWYVFLFGSLFALASVLAGGVDTGWTFYTPLSTL